MTCRQHRARSAWPDAPRSPVALHSAAQGLVVLLNDCWPLTGLMHGMAPAGWPGAVFRGRSRHDLSRPPPASPRSLVHPGHYLARSTEATRGEGFPPDKCCVFWLRWGRKPGGAWWDDRPERENGASPTGEHVAGKTGSGGRRSNRRPATSAKRGGRNWRRGGG